MIHSDHKSVLACRLESPGAALCDRPSERRLPQWKRRVFFYGISSAAVLGLMLFVSGCSNAAAQKSRALAATLTPAPAPPPPGVTIQSQNVYLDASMSMKGFVNPAYHSQFDEFIDGIGDLMPGCFLYKYGQGVGAKNGVVVERASFGLELHQPSFYDLAFNPDDRLIERLANEEQSNLSILVTDGVYSEPQGATAPPVVQAAQHWMERGGTLGIFIFRSDFDGAFYSERARNWLKKLPPIKGRPFYAFVFSPTVKAFRDLQARFQQRFPEMKSLAFASDAVSCTPVLNERLRGTYSYKRPPEVPYYWHMFDSALFEQQNPAPVGYAVKCTLSPDYPATGLKFDANADYYRWQNNSFQKAPSTPDGFSVELDPDKVKGLPAASGAAGKAGGAPQPDFIVYFPKDAGGDYGFYHLRLTALPKEDLRPDVAELSTRDDRQPQDVAKTFRFSELISALMQIHFKSRLADKAGASIFVTIDNH